MTKQEHTEYTRQWQLWRKLRRKPDPPKKVKCSVIPINEETMEIKEKPCSIFSCGRILTLEESLCGDRCKKHVHMVEIDIMKWIRFK